MMYLLLKFLFVTLILLIAPVARAETLPPPGGQVLLTLSGALSLSNSADGTARFDLALLQHLDPVTISTSTIWTEGVHEFTGVPLSRLMAAAGADGSGLHAVALNDYAVDIPMTDAVDGGPILAFQMDGQPMSVRDKGPLWIIYPFDAKPEYQSEVIYSRSIWQLDRIIVTP